MPTDRQRYTDTLDARPAEPHVPVAAGETLLNLPGGRRAILYVPAGSPAGPAPLAVMLHGAGGRGEDMRFSFPLAADHGCLVLSPDSLSTSWDIIHGRFGPDVSAVDDALRQTFARVRVDARRVAIGGFSDGASYALSLGTKNGALFSHVIAFSPGFMAGEPRGPKPRIFVSHGTGDRVLAIGPTSRRLVPQLQSAGYDVTYREFDGPHTIPAAIGREAFRWFTS